MTHKDLEKRILLILPYGSVGGMERLAKTFYDYYKSQGFMVKAVKFIKLEKDIINFGEDELFLSTRDFHSMPFISRYFFYIKAPWKLRKILNKYDFTHSIAFGDMANLFSSLTFTKEYKIGSVHALKSVELSSPSPFNRFIRTGFKSSYKFIDKLVCISNSIKQDLIKNCGYKFSNLEVIYNPHDISVIRELASEPIDTSSEKALFDSQTILFLGRLSIQKAPWHLIYAFYEVAKVFPEVKLVFIGDGDYEVQVFLKKQLKSLQLEERVIFLGRRNNPYKYLKRASCLALSSYYEGTPNVIVEALALDTPVISSNCTRGIFELMSLDNGVVYEDKDLLRLEGGIVTPNFYTGSLVIPSEIRSETTDKEKLFAKALEDILNDTNESASVVKHSKELLEKFDLSTIANHYLTK